MPIKSSLPFYLQQKLHQFGINDVNSLCKRDYLHVFQWLKDVYPSVGYRALFDLHCLVNQLPLNSLNQEAQRQLKSSYKQLLPQHAPLALTTITKYLDMARLMVTTGTHEIPVGAIIVKDNEVISFGTNQTITNNNITHHAEIVAITNAANKLGNHRLNECDLYVTIEPCLMCVGAIIHSRIKRLVFGAIEPKTGAVISQYQALNNISVNKHTEAIGPVDNNLYAQDLQLFLRAKREISGGSL